MPCDAARTRRRQTQEQRKAEIDVALARLEKELQKKTVKVKLDAQGRVLLTGWQDQDRAAMNDACTVRKLMASGSWEFRKALAVAEKIAGRKLNTQTLAAGTHSHDGGKTWGSD